MEITRRYPRQSRAVRDYIKKLSVCEKEKHGSAGSCVRPHGNECSGEIFVFREDEWSDDLRTMGFFLGKFIYLMDAYENLSDDLVEWTVQSMEFICGGQRV